MADWFDQHAPSAQPQASSAPQQDWFDQHAPKQTASPQPTAASHYDSLAPKPQSWWDKAEEAIVAPIRESSIGRAFHKDTITEAEKERHPELKDDTYLRLTEAHPEKLTSNPEAKGVLKGAARFGTGLLSPTNLAMMVGTMGLGEVPGAGVTLSKIIGGGFTFEMVRSAANMSPKLLQQIKIGDHEGAAETLTEMAGSLGMAYAGMSHMTAEAKPRGLEPPPEKSKSPVPPKAQETKGSMNRAELEKWHEDFERDHPEHETKPPKSETKAAADEHHAPPHVDKPGAIDTFLKDEEGTFNPRFAHESTEEMRAKYNLRKQGVEALKNAEGSPMQKNWGQRGIEWFSGERNVWIARVSQELSRARKNLVPDKLDREALTLIRDFKDRPGELQQFADGTHPDLFHLGRGLAGPSPQDAITRIEKAKPIIERALNPTPGMLKVDQTLSNIAEVSLLTGKKLGMLDSKLTTDEYVPHMLHPKPEGDTVSLIERFQGTSLGGKIQRRLGGFSKAREAYPTMLHAIADGAVPKTMDALDAFEIYSDRFATARATKLFQMKLKDSGVGKWSMGGGNVPDNWVPFAAHSNEFKNLVTVTGSDGMPASAEQRLYVPKFIDDAMRPITDPDYTSRLPKFASARVWQSGVKAASLSLSFFHAKALTLMATANMNPFEAKRALSSNLESPEMEEQERDLILHTGTSDILGKTHEAYHHLNSNSIPTWSDIMTSAPGLKQLNTVSGKITEFTFGNLQRKYKVWDFATKKAAWIGEHPNATAAELTAAKISIAKQTNAVYGGLSWETLGWSRAALQLTRSIMLAPDWTISNFYNLKQSFDGGAKGAVHQAASMVGAERALPAEWEGDPGGKAARMFWIRGMVGGIIANQLTSYALTGQWSPSLTNVYMGKDKKGNNIMQNMFFSGAPGDLVNVLNKSDERGIAVGAAQWLGGKLSPGVRGAGQLIANKSWNGQPIIPKGMDNKAATIRGAEYIGRDLAPIPFSAQNLYDQTLGPNAGDYEWQEYLTTVIAGTAPQHRPPAGMHQTKNGMKPDKAKEKLSWWDQALTGKVYPTKNP